LCDQLLREPGRQRLRARFANLEPAGSLLLRTLTEHENAVNGALLLQGEKRALSWSMFDRTLRLWDLETRQQVGKPLTGHGLWVNGVLLLPGGKTGSLLVWGPDAAAVGSGDRALGRCAARRA